MYLSKVRQRLLFVVVNQWWRVLEKGMLLLMSNPKKRNKIKSFLRDYLYSDQLSFDAKMNNSIGGTGITAALLVALVHIIAGSDTIFILIIVTLAIVVAAIVYFANRFQLYKQAIVIDMILVCDIFFPLVFFLPGGINGSTTYFVLTILMIVLIIEGKAMYLLLGSHVLMVAACLYITASRPDLISPVTESQKSLNDIIAVVVTTLMLGAIIIYRHKLFMDEQKKVEAANQMLRKRDLLLRCMNEAATILLAADNAEFSDSFNRGIGLVAGGIGADKATLWKIIPSDNGNGYENIWEWEESKGVSSVEELPEESDTFTTSMPYWDEKLRVGEYVTWNKHETGEEENSLSELTGVKTMLVVPVFIFDGYWGAISFVDMHTAHHYSAEEIDFTRSGSLIIANAYIRDSSTKALVEAREKAIGGMRAKTDFLSNMSHEIRTPMNAIIGMTTIAKSCNNPEKTEYCLKRIEDASAHMLRLINDILDMSKIEANKLELSQVVFCFEKMLKRTENVTNYRLNEKSQTISVQIDKNIPYLLYGDDYRLLQVITNLLSNAVKFTPGNGSIAVKAALVQRDGDKCRIRISVTDTGIGISADQQTKLFASFQQADSSTSRKFGGTGLGLAISKRIVDMMGGRIWVESELGKGSTFLFEVELGLVSGICQSDLQEGRNWNKLSVLAVSDDAIIREFFMDVAEQLNLNCEITGDCEEASRQLNEGKTYDIFFIDGEMPEMSGIKLARYFKSVVGDNAGVVIISSNQWQNIESELWEMELYRFLSKPLFLSDVVDCINACMGIETLRVDKNDAADYCFSGRIILLVEDIEINREILIALLEPTEISIDCANNGVEALQLIADNPEKYDLIFMDIQMPEMDGLEATRRIRALDHQEAKKIPIIALTANAFSDDAEKSLLAGMNAHLGKPFEYDDIIAVLRRYLSQP